MDVREIPVQIFSELTNDRQPEAHNHGIEICDMDHRLWLRLDSNPSAPSQISLAVISAWGDDVQRSQIADLPYDLWGTTRLSTLIAGRTETGVETRNARQLESTISLISPRVEVRFSDPRSSESMIYGLELTREIARRAFVRLQISAYDTSKFMSDELELD